MTDIFINYTLFSCSASTGKLYFEKRQPMIFITCCLFKSFTFYFAKKAVYFLMSALKCCTFCFSAVTRIASFYTDFSRMAFAFCIIHTICRLTVNIRSFRCTSGYIRIGISLSLLKTVTTGFSCRFCVVSADFNCIQITQKLLIVHMSVPYILIVA